ncbi:MAG: hypothetical protein ACI32C_05860 [Candidatus Enteromonas sp.]
MTNFLIFLNLISAISSSSTITFDDFLSQCTPEDNEFAVQNNITDWNDYTDFIQEKSQANASTGLSEEIKDLKFYLNRQYGQYRWYRNDAENALTSDVSNGVPVDMKTKGVFPKEDIEEAIVQAGVQDKTSYGGCGPIAAMGVLDYFSRFLGYNEIISDPTEQQPRRLGNGSFVKH